VGVILGGSRGSIVWSVGPLLNLHLEPCVYCLPALPACVVAPQDNNAIVRTFGIPRAEEKLYNHVDLVQLLVRQAAGAQPRGVGRGRDRGSCSRQQHTVFIGNSVTVKGHTCSSGYSRSSRRTVPFSDSTAFWH
jgi:hypothetical protein